MAALSGRTAKVKTTAVAPTSSTGEATTKLSTGVYQITDYTKRHLDRNTTGLPVVYVNTTIAASSKYQINPVSGIISFDPTSYTTGAVPVTADIHYLTGSYLGQTRSWSADVATDMLYVTAFATSTGTQNWRKMIPGLTGGTVELGRFVSTGSTTDTEPLLFDGQYLGSDLVVELHMNDFDHFEGFAYVNSDSWENEIDGLPQETVSLTLDGPLYFSTSS